MDNTNNAKWITQHSIGWLCCLLISLVSPLAAEPAEAVRVIVNSSVEESKLSRSALRAIYMRRAMRWRDGSPIKVFILNPQSDTHSAFAKSHLGMFPHQLESIWDRLVYSGTGSAPERVASEDDMLSKVAETPGAIGYMETVPSDGRIKVMKR